MYLYLCCKLQNTPNAWCIRPIDWEGCWNEKLELYRGSYTALFNTEREAKEVCDQLNKVYILQQQLNETKQKLTLANIQSIKYYNLYCEKLKENTILKENAEHNDKVVDKIKWENMILKGKHGQKN